LEITDEEQSQRGLHRGSGSEKQRCRHGARWLNLFTGAVIAVLVMLSVILTASVLYPDISGDLIVEVLIGGSLLAIFVFLVVDGLRRRRCFREEPVDRSTRVTWRMPPLGELTKAKPTSGEEDLAHRAAPLPRRRGWVGAGSHRSARGERQWLRPRGVRTMALSPRIQVLVSFILVKACLMAAEWLLRGARALRHRGLLGSREAGAVLRWSHRLTRAAMRMWRHEQVRQRSRQRG
jgi:hypothetical protein